MGGKAMNLIIRLLRSGLRKRLRRGLQKEVEMLERFEEIFRRKILPEEREKHLRMSDEELLRDVVWSCGD